MESNNLLIFFAINFWFTEARVISLREPRLSLAEESPNYYFKNYDGHSNTYMFGYDSDNQYRTEERYPNGTVVGSYGYIGPDGTPFKYNYIADEKGYRVMKDRSNQNKPNSNKDQSNMNKNQNDMYQYQNDMNQNQNDMYQNQNDMYQYQNGMNQNQNDMYQYQNDMNQNQNDMYQNQNDMYQYQNGMNQNQNDMYQYQNNMNWIENGMNQNQYQQDQQYMNQNNMNGNEYQGYYNDQYQYQQNNNVYHNQQYQQTNPKDTTEDSITWSRPKKQKNRSQYQGSYHARSATDRITSRQDSIDPLFSYVPMLRKSQR